MSRLKSPDLLGGLRRHWATVLVITLLGTAAGWLGSVLLPDTYVSQANVRILHDIRLDLLGDASDVYETVEEANRRMESAALSVLSDEVVDRAAEEADVSPEQVRAQVGVEPLAGADVLVISAEADDPRTAVELARATTDAFVDYSRDSGVGELLQGAAYLDDQAKQVRASPQPVPDAISTSADELEARALELRTRAAMYRGAGEVINEAREPVSSARPGPQRGAGLGLAAGLITGVAVALLLSMRPDRREQEPEQPSVPALAGRT